MGKLTHDEFFASAMENLRTIAEDGKREYKGLHTVYSGSNEAFRVYFEGGDPVGFIKALEEAGTIVSIPVRGGVRVYWPSEAPNSARKTATQTLKRMGL